MATAALISEGEGLGEKEKCSVAASGKKICVNKVVPWELLCHSKKEFRFDTEELQKRLDSWKEGEGKLKFTFRVVCPLNFALDLHRRYEKLLVASMKVQQEYGQRLMAAEFTHNVCVKHQEKHPGDFVWDEIKDDGRKLSGDLKSLRMLMKACKESIESGSKPIVELVRNPKFGPHLEKYNKFLGKTYPEAIESGAEAVVDLLKDPAFLAHLHEYHEEYSIDRATATLFYPGQEQGNYPKEGYAVPEGLEHEDFKLPAGYYDEKEPYWREIDHYFAVLTENLAASEGGTRFLRNLIGSEELWSKEMFGTSAGYLQSISEIPGPLGVFLYNLIEPLSGQILEEIAKGRLNLNQLMNSPVKGAFENLYKMTGDSLDTLLKSNSEALSEAMEHVKRAVRLSERKDFILRLKNLSKKLESSPWASAAFTSVVLVVNAANLFDAYQKGYDKDEWGFIKAHLGLVQSGAGLVGTYAESLKSTALKWGETNVRGLTRVGKVAGVSAAILGAVISAIDAKVAGEKGRTGEQALHTAAGLISIAGGVAGLIGVTTVALPLALTGIAIGLIIAAVKESAFEEWLSLGPWGDDHDEAKPPYKYEVKDVVARYFTTVANPAKILPPEFNSWFRDSKFHAWKRPGDAGIVRPPSPWNIIILAIETMNAEGCFLQAVIAGEGGSTVTPRVPVTGDLTKVFAGLPTRPESLNWHEPEKLTLRVTLHLPEENQGLELDAKKIELPVWQYE